MRVFGLAAAFFALALGLSGCSIVIEGGGGSGIPYPGPGDDSATIAEIDAAAGLTFDDGKRKAFVGIASRPHLLGQAQVYLVKKAMRSLTFDDSKEAVLVALVKNPYFVAEGKQAVLEHLNSLTFDSGKEKVLQAINRRGHVPTERELYWQLEREQQRLEPVLEEGAIEMETTVEMEAEFVEEL